MGLSERRSEAALRAQMEIFAGFGAQIDYEMGRVLDAAAALPGADNTLVIYIMGDNGSSAEGGLDGETNENAAFNGVLETWQSDLKYIDELGGPKHYNHFPAGWAWAMDYAIAVDKAGSIAFRRHP
jgi:arylsulfatase A-like enzyme